MGGPSVIHLPDGRDFTVTPVFAGLFFKSHELNMHHNSAFPIGWTVVLHTEEEPAPEPAIEHRRHASSSSTKSRDSRDKRRSRVVGDGEDNNDEGVRDGGGAGGGGSSDARKPRIKAFSRPTLQNDLLFISSISNPSSSDFKPAASPTRQIAMMLWITLYWYFHQQPAPSSMLPVTAQSSGTPEAGRPRGEWRINVRRDGVLRGRNLIAKLERMGLIATLDSAVGTALDDSLVSAMGGGGAGAADDGWGHMFVSRRAFWQIPARLFLFTLQPNTRGGSGSFPGSPVGSRPGSPAPTTGRHSQVITSAQLLDCVVDNPATATTASIGDDATPAPLGSLAPTSSFPIGPFYSSSHLPTYYPPAPPQYTMTNGVRHPVRPKPPRQGEVFYSRFVPSAGAYLSFRVASLSPRPVQYLGAVGPASGPGGGSSSPPLRASAQQHAHLATLPDTSLLQMWLARPRVSKFWGPYLPDFLSRALASLHSFPAIAMWDGVPFAYLEFYWLKEDAVGRYLGGAGGSPASDWDRGVHVLVGEEWARGQVQLWLSSAVHWIFCADYRTMSVCMEPRVDNERFIQHLQAGGFAKETEISLPHKQAWFGRLRRENWEGPTL